jgi:hypothetical protein
MISDLDKFGFSDETIADLISQVSGQDVSEHYVKDSLKKARHKISNSIKPVEDFLSRPSN